MLMFLYDQRDVRSCNVVTVALNRRKFPLDVLANRWCYIEMVSANGQVHRALLLVVLSGSV
jgi:hypothetical protein